ncbi:DUF5711 family protein [Anaerosalibacter sp. Marseille-P3206]|uniref:DUF5711 family protein n=1 Tax=Anaerosalibacter sp. Marseille-P3206 TaxID=1871005 RepID=UPI00098665E1|nr:DUF5711 family protein [Anaerosalibacter sp. Marseille-P3206]
MEDTNNKNKSGFKIFILFMFFAVAIFFGKGHLDKLLPNKESKTLQIVHKIPATSDTAVKFYKNVMIKYDNNVIVAINRDGTQAWEKKVTFEKPIVYLGEEVVYLSEGTTGDVYIINEEGKSTNRIQLNNPIDKVIEKEGIIYVVGKQEKKENLTLLTKDGKVLTSILPTGNILNFAFNDTLKKILISTLNIGEDNIMSSLNIYNINGNSIGNVKFTDEIITFIDFIDEENIIVLTDSGLYGIKESKILWKKDYSNVKDIYIDEEIDKMYLLYEHGLELLNYDGRVEETLELKGSYNSIYPYKKSVLIVGDEEVLGLEKREEYLRYQLEEEGEIKVDGLNIIQNTSDKINVMKIINKDKE